MKRPVISPELIQLVRGFGWVYKLGSLGGGGGAYNQYKNHLVYCIKESQSGQTFCPGFYLRTYSLPTSQDIKQNALRGC